MTNSRKLEAQEDEGYLSEVSQGLRSGFRYELSAKMANVKYKEGRKNVALLTDLMGRNGRSLLGNCMTKHILEAGFGTISHNSHGLVGKGPHVGLILGADGAEPAPGEVSVLGRSLPSLLQPRAPWSKSGSWQNWAY